MEAQQQEDLPRFDALSRLELLGLATPAQIVAASKVKNVDKAWLKLRRAVLGRKGT